MLTGPRNCLAAGTLLLDLLHWTEEVRGAAEEDAVDHVTHGAAYGALPESGCRVSDMGTLTAPDGLVVYVATRSQQMLHRITCDHIGDLRTKQAEGMGARSHAHSLLSGVGKLQRCPSSPPTG
jgi:hypothetical protein